MKTGTNFSNTNILLLISSRVHARFSVFQSLAYSMKPPLITVLFTSSGLSEHLQQTAHFGALRLALEQRLRKFYFTFTITCLMLGLRMQHNACHSGSEIQFFWNNTLFISIFREGSKANLILKCYLKKYNNNYKSRRVT